MTTSPSITNPLGNNLPISGSLWNAYLRLPPGFDGVGVEHQADIVRLVSEAVRRVIDPDFVRWVQEARLPPALALNIAELGLLLNVHVTKESGALPEVLVVIGYTSDVCPEKERLKSAVTNNVLTVLDDYFRAPQVFGMPLTAQNLRVIDAREYHQLLLSVGEISAVPPEPVVTTFNAPQFVSGRAVRDPYTMRALSAHAGWTSTSGMEKLRIVNQHRPANVPLQALPPIFEMAARFLFLHDALMFERQKITVAPALTNEYLAALSKAYDASARYLKEWHERHYSSPLPRSTHLPHEARI